MSFVRAADGMESPCNPSSLHTVTQGSTRARGGQRFLGVIVPDDVVDVGMFGGPVGA